MEQDKVITIVGLGVVGGSYAIALSKKGYTVYGVNRSSESLDMALECGAIKKERILPKNFLPRATLSL